MLYIMDIKPYVERKRHSQVSKREGSPVICVSGGSPAAGLGVMTHHTHTLTHTHTHSHTHTLFSLWVGSVAQGFSRVLVTEPSVLKHHHGCISLFLIVGLQSKWVFALALAISLWPCFFLILFPLVMGLTVFTVPHFKGYSCIYS